MSGHGAWIVLSVLLIGIVSWPTSARAQTLRECVAAMDTRPVNPDRVVGSCVPVGQDTRLAPPDRSTAFTTAALALLHARRPGEALEYGLQATDISPRQAFALGLVAMIYVGLGRPDDGLNYAEQAINADPEGGMGLAAKGAAHMILKQPELAAPAFAAAIKDSPRDFSSITLAIQANLQLLRYDEVERLIQNAEAIDPRNSQIVHARAKLLLARGQYDLALAKIDEAEKLGLRGYGLYLDRAIAAFFASRFVEAEQAARQATLANPTGTEGQCLLTVLLAANGDMKGAGEAIEQSVKVPADLTSEAVALQAVFMHTLQRYDRVTKAFQLARSLDPRFLALEGPPRWAFYRRVESAAREGRSLDLAQEIQSAADAAPRLVENQFSACQAAAQRDPPAYETVLSACAAASRDVGLDETSRERATWIYADALSSTDQHREAIAVAEDGLRRWRDSPALIAVVAVAALQVKDYEKSLAAAKKMMVMDPDSAGGAFMAADSLTQLKRYDEAEKMLAIAVARGLEDDIVKILRGEIAQGRLQPAAWRDVAEPSVDSIDAPFVVVTNANVRSAPQVTAGLVETLSRGTTVTALGKVRDQDWYLIARDGQRLGYVFGPLVAPVGSPKALAVLGDSALARDAPRPAATVAENRDAVAVIIGNRTYGRDVPEVSYAHNDADAMKRYVMDVLGYRDGNIIDLRDATLAELNRVFGNASNPKAQLANWIRAGRSDVTVFYSGHGVPGLNDKRGYLLPVDGDPNLAEVTGYPLDVLQRNLAALPARSMQVFIDGCFSGNSAGGVLLRATSGIGISTPLPDTAGANFVMLTAASGDQVASWDHEAKQGLFTRHLLTALSGVADGTEWGDGDGAVTLSEVKAYLDDEMTFQARRRFNREQRVSIVGAPAHVVAQKP
ncbi:MAG: caspase family protein [Alphaproteobacteria bacterium]|nr:caspase family protein [Alphaproteobacteria bacterium]